MHFVHQKSPKRRPREEEKETEYDIWPVFFKKCVFSKTFVLLKQKHGFWVPKGAKIQGRRVHREETKTRKITYWKNIKKHEKRRSKERITIFDLVESIDIASSRVPWQLKLITQGYRDTINNRAKTENLTRHWPEARRIYILVSVNNLLLRGVLGGR